MNDEELFSEDIHTVMLDGIESEVFIGTSSVIGKRDKQQDAVKADDFYAYAESGRIIAVLCDGMGGMSSGEKASGLCSSILFDEFHNYYNGTNTQRFFKQAIRRADAEVRNIGSESGQKARGAGTTVASVIINEKELYWASVGDSRIYLIRDGRINQITEDHNYFLILQEMIEKGEITRGEAERHPKREALISYIGIGGVKYIDTNDEPFALKDNDYIVLCSDGLYRTLSEAEIMEAVVEFGKETQFAAQCLTDLALAFNKPNQDNTTAVVINYREKD